MFISLIRETQNLSMINLKLKAKGLSNASRHHNKMKTNQTIHINIKMTTSLGRQTVQARVCDSWLQYSNVTKSYTNTVFVEHFKKKQSLLSTGNPFNSNGTAFAYTSSSCFDSALLVPPSIGMNRKSPEGCKLWKNQAPIYTTKMTRDGNTCSPVLRLLNVFGGNSIQFSIRK